MSITYCGTPAPFDSDRMLEDVGHAYIVNRMARELRSVPDLTDARDCVIALRLGGFSDGQIDRYIDSAYLQASEERKRTEAGR